MNTSLRPGVSGLVGLLVWISALACTSSECTELRCFDQLVVELRQSEGAWSETSLELNIDGREVQCEAVGAPARGDIASSRCDGGVAFYVIEETDCESFSTGEKAGQSCRPNGDYVGRLVIDGTPLRLRVELLDDRGRPLAEQIFDPEYVEEHPNGPDCEPVCREAREQMEW